MAVHSTEWMDQAACLDVEPDLFFPESAKTKQERYLAKQAKRICNQECPVRTECLAAALLEKKQVGIKGGMSERERNKLLRQRAAQAPV